MILAIMEGNTTWTNKLCECLGDTPVVFASNKQQVQVWSKLVDAIFITHMTSALVEYYEIATNINVYLVLPESPSEAKPINLGRNIRDSNVKDAFLLSDENDVERLKLRFSPVTITESLGITDQTFS